MVGLPLIIDCLRFSFFFSLLTTKVYNCSLFVYCLVGSGNHTRPKVLRSGNNVRFKSFGSGNHATPAPGSDTKHGCQPAPRSDTKHMVPYSMASIDI
jgi:hypothetical protein